MMRPGDDDGQQANPQNQIPRVAQEKSAVQEELPPTRVLAIPSGLIPTAIIGVITPLKALDGSVHLRVRLPKDWTPEDITWADVVVFSRNHDVHSLEALQLANSLQVPTIYEIDDSYFDIPANIEQLRNYRQPALLLRTLEFLTCATRVHAYSAFVSDRVRALGADVVRPPTYFDDSLRVTSAAETVGLPSTNRVAFPSGRGDTPEMRRFSDAVLARILDSNREIELHLWRDPGPLREHPRVVWHPIVLEYGRFIEQLKQLQITVGLAFLGDSPLEKCATNNKFRELGGLGIPGVYSKTPVFDECVVHMESGLLCGSEVDVWVRSVERLLRDESLRHHIAETALKKVATEFTLERSLAFWTESIASVRSAARASPQITVFHEAALKISPSPSDGLVSRAAYITRAVLAQPAGSKHNLGQGPHLTLVEVAKDNDMTRLEACAGTNCVVDATRMSPDALERVLEDSPSRSAVLVPLGTLPDADWQEHPWLPNRLAQHGGQTLIASPTLRGGPESGVKSWDFAVGLAGRSVGRQTTLASNPVRTAPATAALVWGFRANRTARSQIRRASRVFRQPPKIWMSLVLQRLSRSTRTMRLRG